MQDQITSALDTQECRQLYILAHARAHARGLDREALEDCALAFVEHILRQIEVSPEQTKANLQSAAWIFRCADNWAKNYVRQNCRRNTYERSWPEEALEQSGSPAKAFSYGLPDSAQQLLRKELTQHLDTALAQLTPAQRILFHCHCIEGETLAHIAETTNRSAAAVRQSLCMLRRRLQGLLLETGLTQAEARDYLYQILTNRG